MTYTLSHLELADWKVAQSGRQVALQRAIIDGMNASGRDTTQAQSVLAGLEETLATHRARRDMIREALDTQRGPSPAAEGRGWRPLPRQ